MMIELSVVAISESEGSWFTIMPASAPTASAARAICERTRGIACRDHTIRSLAVGLVPPGQ